MNKQQGGVPEQGPQVYPDLTSEQIEEIARILDEPQLKRLHGGILALSLSYVAAVQEAPRAIRQLRAALERPRPALPAPESPEYDARQADLLAQDIRILDGSNLLGASALAERLVGQGWRLGAALPAEHAPPSLSERIDSLTPEQLEDALVSATELAWDGEWPFVKRDPEALRAALRAVLGGQT